MSTNVLKFGGTSLCSAEEMINAASIATSDGDACAVVVSAPGKRTADDEKVTDLLYRACLPEADRDRLIGQLRERFDSILRGVGGNVDLSDEYEKIRLAAERGDVPYVVSRGEYFSARITAAITGYEFVDAAEIVGFDENGSFLKEKTRLSVASRLKKGGRYVIPGFYGADESGKIFVFPRGGSDITGAVVAAATGADIYKNFTDVDGFMFADPKYLKTPRVIEKMTYSEAYFLSAYGADVIHCDAVLYAGEKNVPIRILNTFSPECDGTLIGDVPPCETIRGVAGKRGYFGKNVAAVAVCFGGDGDRAVARCREILAGNGIFEKFVLPFKPGAVFGVDDGCFDSAMRLLIEKL